MYNNHYICRRENAKGKDATMSWQLLAGLSVSFFSLNGIFNRVIMRDVNSDPFAQTIVFSGLVGVFAFIIALFRGGFHYQISLDQVPFFVLIALFLPAASTLNYKSVQSLEASEASILLIGLRESSSGPLCHPLLMGINPICGVFSS